MVPGQGGGRKGFVYTSCDRRMNLGVATSMAWTWSRGAYGGEVVGGGEEAPVEGHQQGGHGLHEVEAGGGQGEGGHGGGVVLAWGRLAAGCGSPREAARGPRGSQGGRREGCRAEVKVRNRPYTTPGAGGGMGGGCRCWCRGRYICWCR